MVLAILRGLFVLLMAAVGWHFIQQSNRPVTIGHLDWLTPAVTLTIGVVVICVDYLARKKLAIFSGSFFGIIVGLLMAYALSFVVVLLVDRFLPNITIEVRAATIDYLTIVVGLICCYLSISFILQTKDDFRFVIPYVEFSKQTKGARPVILDTSVLIDGRIADIAQTGIMESRMIVPRFVLAELQAVADSADKLKRNRGRRGLDVLQKLQQNQRIEVILYDSSARDQNGLEDVDGKLMALALELNARVLTNDFNLNKVASLRGVDAININDLANALKPVVLPGERMNVRLVKAGDSRGQGVGYLEDGTMVVVEQGQPHINAEVEITVTSVLQTSAGKMIFGRLSAA